MRNLALCTFATLMLSGCAVAGMPGPSPLATPPSTPPGPNIYMTAPHATLHSELMVCASVGANIGVVGARGEVVSYTPYIFTPAGALLRDPTEEACLSSGFGWRQSDGGGRPHNGLDLANPDGGFVYAAGDGWVSYADWRGNFGLALEIDHGHGVRTLYGHLSEIDPNLKPGVFVAAGTPVARMGATGNATGVHLHYEVSVDGLQVDPLAYGLEPPPVL